MSAIIKFALRSAMVLAGLGLLIPATKYMMYKAAKTQQAGLVSFSRLNRSLWNAKPIERTQKRSQKLDKQ